MNGAVPARAPMVLKPHLKWNKRTTVDEGAKKLLADIRPGAFESNAKSKAFNLEIQPGKRVLIESPVIYIPWGASSEMKDKARAPRPCALCRPVQDPRGSRDHHRIRRFA